MHDEADLCLSYSQRANKYPLFHEPYSASIPSCGSGPYILYSYMYSTMQTILHCILALEGADSFPRGAHFKFCLRSIFLRQCALIFESMCPNIRNLVSSFLEVMIPSSRCLLMLWFPPQDIRCPLKSCFLPQGALVSLKFHGNFIMLWW